jgi:hypothetical protein
MRRLLSGVCLGAAVSLSLAQDSSWPHDYPGKPSGDYSPEWQDCPCLPYPLYTWAHRISFWLHTF